MASPLYSSSSSNHHSSNLHSISFHYNSLRPKPSSILTLPIPTSSSHSHYLKKFSLGLVSNDTVMVEKETKEEIGLENLVIESARNVVSFDINEVEREVNCGFFSDLGCVVNVVNSRDTITSKSVHRRRKRRKKAGLVIGDYIEDDSGNEWIQQQPHSSSTSSHLPLTPREEAELSFHIQEGARLETARRKIRENIDKEPTTSEWAEAVGMKRSRLEETILRARNSRDRIILSYRRLVVSIAIAYQGKGLTLQDLIQEGSIGLLRGVEKFDPERGYKMSTYVYWWIKQGVIRAIENKSRIIRLPGSMCEMVRRIAKASTTLTRRLGRWPTYDEIAKTIDVDISIVRLASESSRPPISLDQASTTLHGCVTLQDIIPAPEETRPDTMVERKEMKQNLQKLLKKVLSEREEFILRLCFGLNGETPRSCDEIGRVLNLSRERVRQIRVLALSKLREEPNVLDNLRVYIM